MTKQNEPEGIPAPVVKTYDKCPVCKFKGREYGDASEEVRQLNLFPPDFSMSLQVGNAVVSPPQALQAGTIPAGTVLPYIQVLTDICSNPNCGNVYATQVIKGYAKLEKKPQIILPGQGPLPPGGRQN